MEGGYEVDRGYAGRYKGGFWQQRNDGEGCATIRERSDSVESLVHM